LGLHQGKNLGILKFDDLLLPSMDPTGNNGKLELPGFEDEAHGTFRILFMESLDADRGEDNQYEAETSSKQAADISDLDGA